MFSHFSHLLWLGDRIDPYHKFVSSKKIGLKWESVLCYVYKKIYFNKLQNLPLLLIVLTKVCRPKLTQPSQNGTMGRGDQEK